MFPIIVKTTNIPSIQLDTKQSFYHQLCVNICNFAPRGLHQTQLNTEIKIILPCIIECLHCMATSWFIRLECNEANSLVDLFSLGTACNKLPSTVHSGHLQSVPKCNTPSTGSKPFVFVLDSNLNITMAFHPPSIKL